MIDSREPLNTADRTFIVGFALCLLAILAIATCAFREAPNVWVAHDAVPVVASRAPVVPDVVVAAPVAAPPVVNQVAPPAVVVKAKHRPHRVDRGEAAAYAKAYANAARANQLLGEHRFNTAGSEYIGLHRALSGGGIGFVVPCTIAVWGG